MIRNDFYNKIKTLIPNITQLTVNDLINELMDSYDVILVLFLYIAFAILYVLV